MQRCFSSFESHARRNCSELNCFKKKTTTNQKRRLLICRGAGAADESVHSHLTDFWAPVRPKIVCTLESCLYHWAESSCSTKPTQTQRETEHRLLYLCTLHSGAGSKPGANCWLLNSIADLAEILSFFLIFVLFHSMQPSSLTKPAAFITHNATLASNILDGNSSVLWKKQLMSPWVASRNEERRFRGHVFLDFCSSG